MDEGTTVAQALPVTADSAGYDAACKRVLSEKAMSVLRIPETERPKYLELLEQRP